MRAMYAWIGDAYDRTDNLTDYPVLMTIRDVTGGITIPDGETLTVNYRLQATA